jgi:hypothetical protein
LEDVLEALLQEQIYDESDKYEREALQLSRRVAKKWKLYTRRKKLERNAASEAIRNLSLGSIVEEAMEVDERTGLLSKESSIDNNAGFLSPIQGVKDFFGTWTGQQS